MLRLESQLLVNALGHFLAVALHYLYVIWENLLMGVEAGKVGTRETHEPKLDVKGNLTWYQKNSSRRVGKRRKQKQKQTVGSEVFQGAQPSWHRRDREKQRPRIGSLGKHHQRETGRKWLGDPKNSPSEQNARGSRNSIQDLLLWVCLGESRPMDLGGELGGDGTVNSASLANHQ